MRGLKPVTLLQKDSAMSLFKQFCKIYQDSYILLHLLTTAIAVFLDKNLLSVTLATSPDNTKNTGRNFLLHHLVMTPKMSRPQNGHQDIV